MEMSQARVAVIVLNWNRQHDTLQCLASLAHTIGPRIKVVLADNASTDGTVDAVRLQYPDVQILQNPSNLGFAAGNNEAIRWALAECYPFILLLNNDTTVAADTIDQLLKPMLDDSEVGVTGAAICYMHAPGTIWSAGGRFDLRRGLVTNDYLDQPLDCLPGAPYRVDHVSGCAMLVRSAAIERAGELDPRFFMYFEETEWCARITLHGYHVVVNPRARVWHSIRPDAQLGSPAIAYYMTRNHLLFLRATGASISAWTYTVFWQIRTIVSLMVRPTTPERARGRVPMLRAMRDFALGRFGPMSQAR
jgi:GT2 family glycosyltransferase